MLRSITSHAARRQRSARSRTPTTSSSSSISALGPHLHGHHDGIGIASSSSVAVAVAPLSISSPLSISLSCCLPCTDNADHHSRSHSTRQSRQLHSLSSYNCSAVGASSSSSSSTTSSLIINSNTTTNNNPSSINRNCNLPLSSVSSSSTTRQRKQHPITIQKRTKVFVSRHNNTLNLTPPTITSYITTHLPHLNANSVNGVDGDFRITSSHVIMKECPFCTKPTNGKPDNMYKLYISVGGGAYFCHRCGAKGSWYDFKSEIGGFAVVDGPSVNTAGNGNGNGNGTDHGRRRSQHNNNHQISQPWNWNTSNNQGMGYVSTNQLNNKGQNYNNNNNANNGAPIKQKVEPLPMPPKKLNSLYTTKLFDPNNSSLQNPKEHAALEYLTKTRGLDRSVLRKYGVGCAPYNFPDKNAAGGISYVSSMCVTFPWLMRASEVAEQEELRGAEFVWRTEGSEDDNGTGRDNNNGNNNEQKKSGRTSLRPEVKSKKKVSDMTALERYHYRKERKDRAKAAKEAEQNGGLDDDDNNYSIEVSRQEEEPISSEDAESLHGPYISRRIKVRSVEQKSWQRLDPPGGGFGLFGWHTVPHNATELIITEGEFDAMAVYQATGRPAVSLPNGCRSLPMEVLVLLEKFDVIYLWMDNDGPGREGAEMFARKLGVERCLVVQPSGKRGWNGTGDDETVTNTTPPTPPKDANEGILTGWDLNELLEEASELPHERILKFSDLRDQVIHEIVNPEKYRGAPVQSLPGFTSLIKGFRRGELTVLTGPTGSGKTTFLGQVSLDLAEQGINVLWGSFEVKNTRLMHKLLQQYMKDVLPVGLGEKNLPEEEKQQQMMALSAIADKFETLPMHFMKFHGGSDVDDVLDAMEYAAYVHDVEHIILDNMQFMISRAAAGGKGSSYDKFDMQDIAIEKFRKFATDYNVHVTLVVHPRKENEGTELGISSFYGSAKATQEADTVLILQSDGNKKFVDVKKNRFDGTLGRVPLYFQHKSGRYSESEVTPQKTKIPIGVSAVPKKQSNGPRASASSAQASIYNDIRGQHPIS